MIHNGDRMNLIWPILSSLLAVIAWVAYLIVWRTTPIFIWQGILLTLMSALFWFQWSKARN